ncbi:fimbrial protein [Pseudomonas cerasi]
MTEVAMNGKLRYWKAACLLVGPLFALPQTAVGARDVTMTVKVTVVAPPSCILNDNKVITVEFGNVMTTLIDGNNYWKPVNYTLSCKANSTNAMKLQMMGTGASFDSTVLRTTKTGLGVKLLQGNTKVPLNSWLNFTYPASPALYVVPVKQPGATLTGGKFEAAATLRVDYQ